jgi:hypothetical protein
MCNDWIECGRSVWDTEFENTQGRVYSSYRLLQLPSNLFAGQRCRIVVEAAATKAINLAQLPNSCEAVLFAHDHRDL